MFKQWFIHFLPGIHYISQFRRPSNWRIVNQHETKTRTAKKKRIFFAEKSNPWKMTQNSCTRGLGIVGIVGSRCMARPLDDGDDFRAIHSNRSMCDVVFSFAANGLRFTVRGQSWKLKVPLVIFYWWTLGQTACMHLLRYMAGHGALWHIHLNGYIIYIYRINCSRAVEDYYHEILKSSSTIFRRIMPWQ